MKMIAHIRFVAAAEGGVLLPSPPGANFLPPREKGNILCAGEPGQLANFWQTKRMTQFWLEPRANSRRLTADRFCRCEGRSPVLLLR